MILHISCEKLNIIISDEKGEGLEDEEEEDDEEDPEEIPVMIAVVRDEENPVRGGRGGRR